MGGFRARDTSAQKSVIMAPLPYRLPLPAPPLPSCPPFILRLVRHKSLTLVANGAKPRPIVTKSSREAVCLQAMHRSGDVQFQAISVPAVLFQAIAVLLSGHGRSSRSALRRLQQSAAPGDVQFAPGNGVTCVQLFFLLLPFLSRFIHVLPFCLSPWLLWVFACSAK